MSRLSCSNRTLVMGVLNVTPDSFSDGGRFGSVEAAIDHALLMIDEGADFIDVGGESSRPGSDPTPESEELSRVLPIIERLAPILTQPISIDTYKPRVAKICLDAGARIVNDINGLRDPEMIAVIAAADIPAIVMHMRGSPKTMQRDTTYDDVVNEVKGFLAERAMAAVAGGIAEIAIDPGIGFGKTAEQNFQLLARLQELSELGRPILIGPSRKSFLGSLTSALGVQERLEGTIAACCAAAMNGAAIVRVHDVRPVRRALEVVDAIRNAAAQEPLAPSSR